MIAVAVAAAVVVELDPDGVAATKFVVLANSIVVVLVSGYAETYWLYSFPCWINYFDICIRACLRKKYLWQRFLTWPTVK